MTEPVAIIAFSNLCSSVLPSVLLIFKVDEFKNDAAPCI